MSGIKNMNGYSSACVRVKGGEIERFRIYSGIREGFIMSPWLFNIYMDGVIKEVKMVMEGEISGGWERVEISWPLV